MKTIIAIFAVLGIAQADSSDKDALIGKYKDKLLRGLFHERAEYAGSSVSPDC
jgi:hypothetical protein